MRHPLPYRDGENVRSYSKIIEYPSFPYSVVSRRPREECISSRIVNKLSILFAIIMEVPVRAIRQAKEIKAYRLERKKLSLFEDDVFFYIECLK